MFTPHTKLSPNGDFFGNFTIYYKKLWSKYGNLNIFPFDYGGNMVSLGDFFQNKSFAQDVDFFLVPIMVKSHHP
jgi:hypothetical protein